MNNAPSNRPKRRKSGLKLRIRARIDWLVRFLVTTAIVLLTLCCWARPSAASEQVAEGPDRPSRLTPRLVRPPAPREQEKSSQEKTDDSPESQVPVEREPDVVNREQDIDPEQEQDVEDSSPYRRVWYGWQNLTVDVGGPALAVAVAASLPDGYGPVIGVGTGVTAYALGGPTVHFAHGNIGEGFASLGLRVGLPAAGLVTGYAIDASQCTPGPYSFCGLGGAILGFLSGAVAAVALDAGVLAYDKVPRRDTAAHSRPLKSLVVLPRVSATGAGVSVNGSF